MKQGIAVLALAILLILVSGSVTLAAPEKQGRVIIHYVDYGEDLFRIAERYRVPVEVLLRRNGLTDPVQIYVGLPLVIPVAYSGGADRPAASPGLRPCENYQCAPAPAVKPGDSGIIPGPTVKAAPPPFHHTVANGETLSGIADRYGVNYFKIVESNNLADAAYIWPGQRLVIPGYQPPPPELPRPEPAGDQAINDRDHMAKAADPENVSPIGPEQTASGSKILPRAGQPVTILVNDGHVWVDEDSHTVDDQDGITTLVVRTRDEPGKTVRIRNGGFEQRGSSEFIVPYIVPAGYEVWIDDPETSTKKVYVELEPGRRTYVNFSKHIRFEGQRSASPDGWALAYWQNPSKPEERLGGWSNILVKTPSSGLLVKIESEGGGYKTECLTGSKGPGACDFAGLNAGLYTFWIDGTDFSIQTYMDGNAYAEFVLSRQPPEPSNIVGKAGKDK